MERTTLFRFLLVFAVALLILNAGMLAFLLSEQANIDLAPGDNSVITISVDKWDPIYIDSLVKKETQDGMTVKSVHITIHFAQSHQ